jgi:hypothetical protein
MQITAYILTARHFPLALARSPPRPRDPSFAAAPELASLLRGPDGALLPNVSLSEKMKFSMMTERVQADMARMAHPASVESAVLFGIEAHVCIQQTALELLGAGKRVFLPIDGVSSQRRGDREVALRLLESAGATLTTSESLLFMLLGTAEHPKFKDVSKLLVKANAATAARGGCQLDALR